MQGWESVCFGVGVLGFLVSWFQSFLVSHLLDFLDSSFLVTWFHRLLDVQFLCFLFSKSLGFKVSKIYQHSISCILEDIESFGSDQFAVFGGGRTFGIFWVG